MILKPNQVVLVSEANQNTLFLNPNKAAVTPQLKERASETKCFMDGRTCCSVYTVMTLTWNTLDLPRIAYKVYEHNPSLSTLSMYILCIFILVILLHLTMQMFASHAKAQGVYVANWYKKQLRHTAWLHVLFKDDFKTPASLVCTYMVCIVSVWLPCWQFQSNTLLPLQLSAGRLMQMWKKDQCGRINGSSSATEPFWPWSYLYDLMHDW